MTINPDEIQPDEQFPKEWDLLGSAQNIMNTVVKAYIDACKDEVLEPLIGDFQDAIIGVMEAHTGFNNNWAIDNLGEGFVLTKEEMEKLKNGN